MKSLDKTVILWLSDIHFKDNYSPTINDVINKLFGNLIHTIKIDYPKIDYLIISGDIAFSGEKEQYENLENLFISRFLREFSHPCPKLLIIPGNHDLKHDATSIEFYTKDDNWNDYITDRNIYFNLNYGSLVRLFENYSTHFKTSSDHTIVRPLDNSLNFDEKGDFEISTEYSNTKLYGTLVDLKKNITFCMINSSWFSIGPTFNERLIENYASWPASEDSHGKDTNLLKMLKIKERTFQYGNQIVGKDKLLDMIEVIEKFPDNMVVLLMHHPLSWLKWDELNSEDSALVYILNKGHLLLTGHEHLPMHCKKDTLFDQQLIHLKAGEFFPHQFKSSDSNEDVINEVSHSRCSIVQINPNKKTINEIRYSSKALSWSQNSVHSGEYSYNFQSRNYSKEELEFLSQEFLNKDFKIKEFYKRKELTLVKGDSYPDFKWFSSNSNLTLDIYIFSIKKDFFNYLHVLPGNICILDNLIQSLKCEEKQKITIRFLIPDLLAYEEVINIYLKSNMKGDIDTSRDECYQRIVANSDFKFNTFRHRFFSRYEDTEVLERYPDFSIIKEIVFINEVLPFWIYKKYIN